MPELKVTTLSLVTNAGSSHEGAMGMCYTSYKAFPGRRGSSSSNYRYLYKIFTGISESYPENLLIIRKLNDPLGNEDTDGTIQRGR